MEHEQESQDLLVRSAREIGLNLTANQVALFTCYLSKLIQWNQTINLTGITDPLGIVIKHFVDSLIGLAATTIPQNSTLIDVGSGPGFPGLPLKIVRRDLQVTLIESNQKKCSFLTSIIGQLKLEGTEVFFGSLEQFTQKGRSLEGVVTVRALRYGEIRDRLIQSVSPNGRIMLYRTEPIRPDELGENFVVESQKSFKLPRDSGNRVISILVPNFIELNVPRGT